MLIVDGQVLVCRVRLSMFLFGSVLIRSRTQESNSNGLADFAIDVRDCLGLLGEEFKLKLSNIVQLQIGKVR